MCYSLPPALQEQYEEGLRYDNSDLREDLDQQFLHGYLGFSSRRWPAAVPATRPFLEDGAPRERESEQLLPASQTFGIALVTA